MIQDNDQNFINRLNRHPKLRERMDVLLNVVENTAGDCTKADDAEHSVIEELRKMGNDALHCWAESAVEKTTETVQNQQPKPQSHGKKKCTGTPPSEK